MAFSDKAQSGSWARPRTGIDRNAYGVSDSYTMHIYYDELI